VYPLLPLVAREVEIEQAIQSEEFEASLANEQCAVGFAGVLVNKTYPC
jgi:hypothetical protein